MSDPAVRLGAPGWEGWSWGLGWVEFGVGWGGGLDYWPFGEGGDAYFGEYAAVDLFYLGAEGTGV